eukprot:7577225-Pyramimonas_sp.AAC.1
MLSKLHVDVTAEMTALDARADTRAALTDLSSALAAAGVSDRVAAAMQQLPSGVLIGAKRLRLANDEEGGLQ